MSARKKRGRISKPLIHASNQPSILGVQLDAIDALVNWRRRWERENTREPTVGNGFADMLRMWKLAGKIMEHRGIARKLPG